MLHTELHNIKKGAHSYFVPPKPMFWSFIWISFKKIQESWQNTIIMDGGEMYTKYFENVKL